MPRTFSEEYEKELKNIIENTDEDLKNMPEEMKHIRTTEDFFAWRDTVKFENGNDKDVRNQIVENLIKGNKSLELLYAWTKFYRVIDKASSDIYPRILFYKYAGKSNQLNTQRLFDIIHVHNTERPVGLRQGFRSFNNSYEFVKLMIVDEDYEPWPIDVLIILMKAYGIDSNFLLGFASIIDECEKEKEENNKIIIKEKTI